MLLKSKYSKAKSMASEETKDGSTPAKSQGLSEEDSDSDQSSIRVVSYREYMLKAKRNSRRNSKPRQASLALAGEIV